MANINDLQAGDLYTFHFQNGTQITGTFLGYVENHFTNIKTHVDIFRPNSNHADQYDINTINSVEPAEGQQRGRGYSKRRTRRGTKKTKRYKKSKRSKISRRNRK